VPAAGSPGPARRSAWPSATAAATALVVLGALAVLVATGHLNGVDGLAVRHLLRLSNAGYGTGSELATGYRRIPFRGGDMLRQFAAPGPSCVLAVTLCAIQLRRRKPVAGLLWLGAFVGVTLVGGFVKLLVVRPQFSVVYHGLEIAGGFHHSFPSGHTARGAVLAATAASLWRRLWPVFATWLAAVAVTVELDGGHILSDLAGGLLLAAALVLAVVAVERRWAPELDRRLARWHSATNAASPASELP
jgi:membrane-associated phospholipid phosphatase